MMRREGGPKTRSHNQMRKALVTLSDVMSILVVSRQECCGGGSSTTHFRYDTYTWQEQLIPSVVGITHGSWRFDDWIFWVTLMANRGRNGGKERGPTPGRRDATVSMIRSARTNIVLMWIIQLTKYMLLCFTGHVSFWLPAGRSSLGFQLAASWARDIVWTRRACNSCYRDSVIM